LWEHSFQTTSVYLDLFRVCWWCSHQKFINSKSRLLDGKWPIGSTTNVN
jgi:hypothetical protein